MYGAMQFWCPVKIKFMTEGKMRRQEHWFHNGNGSAQQRYFNSQNEMLDKYGGAGQAFLVVSTCINSPLAF
jgi:hypothetical protein